MMVFNNNARSTRGTAIIVGAVVFLLAFIGLMFNHLDSWQLPALGSNAPPPAEGDGFNPPPPPPPPTPQNNDNSEPIVPPEAKWSIKDYGKPGKFLIEKMWRPSITVDSPKYMPYGAFEWMLPGEARWKRPMGKNFCIIDLDNRPLDEPYQIFGSKIMSWAAGKRVHGLSLGVLNHWLYAKIHGYKYYFIGIESPEDRRSSWMKAPVISKILKNHDACVYLDSDAIFHHLDLPMEWLMNYWDIHPATNSLALAFDPDEPQNKDKFDKTYLNTGFIILQNNPKTYEILDDWWNCPSEHSKHPDCAEFRFNNPGRPTDQGGFGTFVRYDHAADIKELPCNEANGYPESGSACTGQFIRHLWTGKDTWIKIAVGEQIPGAYLEILHQKYLSEKKDFYYSQKDLLDPNSKVRKSR